MFHTQINGSFVIFLEKWTFKTHIDFRGTVPLNCLIHPFQYRALNPDPRVMSWAVNHPDIKTKVDFLCWRGKLDTFASIMNFMKIVVPLHLILLKKTPNDAVKPPHQSQFTPKMKANAVPRLLSSLVWIDQYNKCYGMTSFMEFMRTHVLNASVYWL